MLTRACDFLRDMESVVALTECSHPMALQLHNRSCCRFFFLWAEQQEQQYCETTCRIASRRRLESDEKWVVPHNLEAALYSCSTVNVMVFDHVHGADQARLYACK